MKVGRLIKLTACLANKSGQQKVRSSVRTKNIAQRSSQAVWLNQIRRSPLQ